MKVKVGGNIGFKIGLGAYQNGDINSTFEIEKEFDECEEGLDEEIQEFRDKVRKQLTDELRKQTEETVNIFLETKRRIAREFNLKT